jgi:alkanesulfonate monooxygenase SsuD/methylene tetrahydromethanopterin reductase-like flavin-dependent oxidoreductase (luciferase family)
MNDREQMHLNYFHFPTGAHEASWRHPDSRPESCETLDYYVSLAQTCERACLDSFFVPGNHGVIAIGETDKALNLDTLLTMMAIAARTERLGLIGTASTTFNHPWLLAKAFASLDHLSGGRAGWNVVTSSTDFEARNFGLPGIPDHETRYAMAAEFVDVAFKLWSAWEDDAVIRDRETGVYADETKVHEIDHVGQYYSVKGPLPVTPSPQRRPLMVQAGASATGKAFAAKYAEAVFCYASTLEAGRVRGQRRAARDGAGVRDAGERHGTRPGQPDLGGRRLPGAGRHRGADRRLDGGVVPRAGVRRVQPDGPGRAQRPSGHCRQAGAGAAGARRVPDRVHRPDAARALWAAAAGAGGDRIELTLEPVRDSLARAEDVSCHRPTRLLRLALPDCAPVRAGQATAVSLATTP